MTCNGCFSSMSTQFHQSMEVGMLGSFCEMFWRSEARGHYQVKLSGWLAGGMMDLLAGSVVWDELLRNFYVVLGDNQLS